MDRFQTIITLVVISAVVLLALALILWAVENSHSKPRLVIHKGRVRRRSSVDVALARELMDIVDRPARFEQPRIWWCDWEWID